MSEDNCAVYVHVNLINGKKYFGITVQEPERRWRNGYGYSNNAHFTNAINKYSWENFAHYVLFKNIPIAIAKNIEEMLILEHMSYDPRFGYNKTYGGELERPTEDTRHKMSEAMKGENNPSYGKPHGDEWRKRISLSLGGGPVEAINPRTGLREHYFISACSADGLGFNHRHVSECCNGKRKTHKGYIWRHVEKEVNDDGSDN